MTTPENRMMQKWRAKAAVLALALAAPLAAFAQNAIQSITASQQAGTDIVRVELSEPLAAVPAGFAVQAPPRVAIDLPGVGNAMGRNAVDTNELFIDDLFVPDEDVIGEVGKGFKSHPGCRRCRPTT